MSESEAPGVSWVELPPGRAAALCALYESSWYTQVLWERACALEDPLALAYVDVALAALDTLEALLDAQEKTEDGRRKTDDGLG